jgi:hypothetical protein
VGSFEEKIKAAQEVMFNMMYQSFSDCVFGAEYHPSPNVKKALFFPISWGKIPNSVVIKLFVKIGNEIFFK